MSRGERLFLWIGWAVIGAAAALPIGRALRQAPEPAPPLPERAWHASEPAAPGPQTPPSEPLAEVRVSGRVVDVPGLPVDPAVLAATRLSLVTPAGDVRGSATPAPDGAFRLEARAPLPGLRLRLHTDLRTPGADIPLRYETGLRGPQSDVGEIALPRTQALGSVTGTVADASGAPLAPEAVELLSLDPLTPPPGLPLNVPTLYRQGNRFTFLRVPPGRYRLRARAPGRRLPPVDLAVSARERTVALAEQPGRLRLQGSARHAATRAPLEDVDVFLDASGDPAWVQGRTSRLGRYDLPLPDPMPADGVAAVYARRGFRGTTVRIAAGDLGPEGVVRLHVELPPE